LDVSQTGQFDIEANVARNVKLTRTTQCDPLR